MGKALLAERLSDDGPDGLAAHLPATLTPLTPHTITDPDLLIADLRETLARGFALDEEENVLGLRCFAFALRLSEKSSDAISCSVPIERLNGREPEIVDALRRTKNSIERMAPVNFSRDFL